MLKSIKQFFLICLFLVMAITPATASTTVKSDIQYGQDKLQALDVYTHSQCTSSKLCPVLIWVHGGGWSNGDKTVMGGEDGTKIGALWSASGAVVVSINYRLTPQVVHPAHVQDVAAAINWVHKNIRSFNGDAGKIYLLGHSAGAHLVALVSTDTQYLAAHGLSPAQNISGVFPIDSAAYSLEEDLNTPIVGSRVEAAFSSDKAALRAASPLTHVRSGQSYPPFILAGTVQYPKGVESMNDMANKLRQSGARAETYVADYPGTRPFTAHRRIAEDLFNPASPMTIKLMAAMGLRPSASAPTASKPADDNSDRRRGLLLRRMNRE